MCSLFVYLPISPSIRLPDVRVCATASPADSTPFLYSLTSFKEVSCSGEGDASFDIVFEEDGDEGLNEIGTVNEDGLNYFVFVLQEEYVRSAGYDEEDIDRSLSCSGKAVLTTTNPRDGSRRLREVSFGEGWGSSRSLEKVGDIQESEFAMSIGIEDSAAAAASARLLSVATAIGSVICAFFIM